MIYNLSNNDYFEEYNFPSYVGSRFMRTVMVCNPNYDIETKFNVGDILNENNSYWEITYTGWTGEPFSYYYNIIK